ncbi:uncharacterized protein [Apostichopus japonicus]|uniref:uncharacterized protein isoform X11 n=1 Tax=Stichopus japonicus TaxID=307972 RepID=UPI003AB84341
MTRQVISIFMRYATRQTAHLAPNLILIMMFKQGRSAFLWNTCGCFAVKIFQDSPATIFTTSQPFPLPATLCTNLLPHRSTILLTIPTNKLTGVLELYNHGPSRFEGAFWGFPCGRLSSVMMHWKEPASTMSSQHGS